LITNSLLSHHFDALKNVKNWFFLALSYKTFKFWYVWKQSHWPHLKVHSPHVASGEWVGQRCNSFFSTENYTAEWHLIWVILHHDNWFLDGRFKSSSYQVLGVLLSVLWLKGIHTLSISPGGRVGLNLALLRKSY